MTMLRREKKSAGNTASMGGGRSGRVCDSCSCKRARWFCAADDAFLCQSCDVSVHSANQLAKRHERIRLETDSSKSNDHHHQHHQQLPPWMKGFTRKARTPRPSKQSPSKTSVFSLVPEISNNDDDDDGLGLGLGLGLLDDIENDDQEEQKQINNQFLHHEVPVFDPFDEENLLLTDELEDFADGFLPSEVDLAEYVADVESLLGIRAQSHNNNQAEAGDEDETDHNNRQLIKSVKIEDGANNNNGSNLSTGGDHNHMSLDWNFKKGEEEMDRDDDDVKVALPMTKEEQKTKKKKNILFLRLNFDAVITAWDGQSSPYTTGNRPDFDMVDDCLGEWPRGSEIVEQRRENGMMLSLRGKAIDGEREARVSRYREKRRTRLFSKKIRYQVRKLNAEKRPRMKGRFVKRTTTTLPVLPFMPSSNHHHHHVFPATAAAAANF